MNKIKSILLHILFLFPFLSFSSAGDNKVAGVKIIQHDCNLRIFYAEKNFQKNIDSIKKSMGSKKFEICFLSENKINSFFDIDNNSKTSQFFSKKDLESLFKEKEGYKNHPGSNLYRFQENFEKYGVKFIDKEIGAPMSTDKKTFFPENFNFNFDHSDYNTKKIRMMGKKRFQDK